MAESVDDAPSRGRQAGPSSQADRGRLIILVGPDGVGKTTVARAILQLHEGPTGYFHFLPSAGGPLAALPDVNPPMPPPKAAPGASRLLGWLRLARNVLRGWASYVWVIRPALREGRLVVGDRWLYGYLGQPSSLRFSGPETLARLMLRLLPRPDLVVNLSAPPDVIRSRKGELTPAQIARELAAWSALPVPRLMTMDAQRAPEAIAREVLRRLAPQRGRHAAAG